MKRFLIALGIVVAVALVILTVMLLYKHFITDQIRDKGGMENPKYIVEADSTSAVDKTENNAENIVSISYYFHHGSMAGMDCNYTISKEPSGTCQFHAELESGADVVDKEISKEEFDAIAQMYIDNYATQTVTETEDTGEEYVPLDANSSCFEVAYADGQTQFADIGQADSEIISQMKKFLDEQ